MSSANRLARSYGLDVLIAIAAAASALEVAFERGGPQVPSTSLWFAVPAVVVVAAPLFARRSFPFLAPAAVWLLGAAVSFVDGRLVVSAFGLTAAGMTAAFLLGRRRDAIQARIGLLVTLGGAAIIVYNDPAHAPGELVVAPLLFAIAWLAGFAVRERVAQAEAAEERALQAEREGSLAARIAVVEERARIARELHDIVAHAVSVMVLQTGAIRHRLPATLNEEKEALKGVEQAGRGALAEMRHLLTAMRDESDPAELAPQPGLDSLGSLLHDIGRTGLAVRLHVAGEPAPLPPGIDLSAYRIVQEGLTNTLKHARATHADVTVCYGRDALEIEVRDDGDAGGEGGGLGHGLPGIRERVKLYGGEMTAGAVPGGGFALTARLPFGERRS